MYYAYENQIFTLDNIQTVYAPEQGSYIEIHYLNGEHFTIFCKDKKTKEKEFENIKEYLTN